MKSKYMTIQEWKSRMALLGAGILFLVGSVLGFKNNFSHNVLSVTDKVQFALGTILFTAIFIFGLFFIYLSFYEDK